MAEYINAGDMVEGKKCSISARRMEFKKGPLRKDPITNKKMVIYELDRNSSIEVTQSLSLSKEEQQLRFELNVHGNVGDRLQADAIRIYVDTYRDCLKTEVKEGQSGRHGANITNTNIRTIGVIKTPFSIYGKILGNFVNNNEKMIEK